MKIMFLCVDAQVDFMTKNGNLYVQDAELINKTIGNLNLLAEEYDITVVNTADWHNKNSKEISDNPDFVNTFNEHCMANTEGAEFIPEADLSNPIVIPYNQPLDDNKESLLEFASEIIIQKDHFDVFEGNPHTERILQLVNPDVIFVYGVATNVCVDAAIQGLLKRGYKTYVVIDAIKELPNLPYNTLLANWVTPNGFKVPSQNDNGVYYAATTIPLPEYANEIYNTMRDLFERLEYFSEDKKINKKNIIKVENFLKEKTNECC